MSYVYILLLYSAFSNNVVGLVAFPTIGSCLHAGAAYEGAAHISKVECRLAVVEERK